MPVASPCNAECQRTGRYSTLPILLLSWCSRKCDANICCDTERKSSTETFNIKNLQESGHGSRQLEAALQLSMWLAGKTSPWLIASTFMHRSPVFHFIYPTLRGIRARHLNYDMLHYYATHEANSIIENYSASGYLQNHKSSCLSSLKRKKTATI
jgi:hypothetical protein